MSAELSIWAGENFKVPFDSGSGLVFTGTSFGAPLEVGEFSRRTFIGDQYGLRQGPEVNNIHYPSDPIPDLGARACVVGQEGGQIDFLQVPNYQATINIRLTYEVPCYASGTVSVSAPGVTCLLAEVDHPELEQSVLANNWPGTYWHENTIQLAQTPGSGGRHRTINFFDSTVPDTVHDWYLLVAPSADTASSKTFGIDVNLDYSRILSGSGSPLFDASLPCTGSGVYHPAIYGSGFPTITATLISYGSGHGPLFGSGYTTIAPLLISEASGRISTSIPIPLHYWKYDEAVGNRTFDWGTGIAITPSGSNVLWGPGHDGSGMRVAAGGLVFPNVPMATGMTWMGWARETGYYSQELFTGGGVSSGVFRVVLNNSGELQVRRGATPSTVIAGTGSIPLNSWIHWAVRRTNNLIDLFVNGGLAATGSISSEFASVNHYYAKSIDGIVDIDDMRIYPQPLSNIQISYIAAGSEDPISYRNGPLPLHWWAFDEGSGTSGPDLNTWTGNRNDWLIADSGSGFITASGKPAVWTTDCAPIGYNQWAFKLDNSTSRPSVVFPGELMHDPCTWMGWAKASGLDVSPVTDATPYLALLAASPIYPGNPLVVPYAGKVFMSGMKVYAGWDSQFSFRPEVYVASTGYVGNSWFHWAMTRSGSGVGLYLNGQFQGSGYMVGAPSGSLYYESAISIYASGRPNIDDIRVYQRLLSGSEIAAIGASGVFSVVPSGSESTCSGSGCVLGKCFDEQLALPRNANLVGWWLALPDSNGMRFQNVALTGSGFDATWSSSSTTFGSTSRTGGYKELQLDGSYSSAKVPSVPDSSNWYLNGDYTLLMWVKWNTVPSASWWETALIAQDQGPGGFPKWIFSKDQATGPLTLHYQPSGPVITSSNWTCATGVWYHVGVTRIGNDYTFYKDGSGIGTASNSAALPDVPSPLTFGYGEGSNMSHAAIDDIQIHKGSGLSASDILAVYNAGNYSLGAC